jgi:hypothetical protein
MEAASVDAFAILHDELAAFGAPRKLLERSVAAQADEVRHADTTAILARRFGAEDGAWSERPVVQTRGRSLEEIATENAVEGCVHETYAALLAMWQAEHARDADVRAAMRSIAEDETRHAALAWSVAEWIERELDVAARARVAAAFEAAMVTLREGILPDGAAARRLVVALGTTLARAA